MESNLFGTDGLLKRLSGLLKGKNASKIIMALGITGILLIALSGVWPSGTKDQKAAATGQVVYPSSEDDDYAQQLSTRLEDTLASMAGVGEVKVLVTIQQDAEYVYAKEVKSSLDQSETHQDESGVSTQSKEDREEEYLIIEGADGKQALLTTRKQPQIQGVVVVCTGGGNPTVVTKVTEAVTTAFGIGASRVCVSELG